MPVCALILFAYLAWILCYLEYQRWYLTGFSWAFRWNSVAIKNERTGKDNIRTFVKVGPSQKKLPLFYNMSWLKDLYFDNMIEKDYLGDWRPEKDCCFYWHFDNQCGSHIQSQQQSFSGLQSPRWSFSIISCYSWVQTIFIWALWNLSGSKNAAATFPLANTRLAL